MPRMSSDGILPASGGSAYSGAAETSRVLRRCMNWEDANRLPADQIFRAACTKS